MRLAKRLADLENTQLKRSYLLSSNAGPDSTHSKNMDAPSYTYSLSVLGQLALTVNLSWALSMHMKWSSAWWGWYDRLIDALTAQWF